MQSRLALATLAFAYIAVATPLERRNGGGGGGSQCNSGDLQCCNSVQPASNPSAAQLLGLLGVVVQGVNVIVGITCTPITVIGLGTTSCSQQTVCCTDNSFNGVVALGCTPVNVAL